MIMKTKSVIFALASASIATLTSCDPQAFTMNVEMRYPSSSGMDLNGKSVAVVYLEQDRQQDSVFNENLVNGFISNIEKDYFNGEESVGIFFMEKDPDGNYESADSLVNLVMDTESDVVFLFDAPRFGNVSVSDFIASGDGKGFYQASVPVQINLYAYDSFAPKDTVMVWNGTRTLARNIPGNPDMSRAELAEMLWKDLSAPAERIGISSAKTFSPTWNTEQYTFIYFDSPSAWISAAEAAYDYRWQEAIKIWMTLLDTKSPMKRSCAEYNIAAACYLLGDNELALKWLHLSDSDNPISLSSTLRKRIEARMK